MISNDTAFKNTMQRRLTQKVHSTIYIDKLLRQAIKKDVKTAGDFDVIKKSVAKEFKVSKMPTNADIKLRYEYLVKIKKMFNSPSLVKALVSKKIRSLSGVAVVAVLTKKFHCRGRCLYCPNEPTMPKSYLSNEPAVMRAISVNFSPYKQVQKRLRALTLNGHAVDKIELIIMGGTFSYLPKKYQIWFVKECFRAANDYPLDRGSRHIESVTALKNYLVKQQKKNEKARNRIVGLTLETRPDTIDEKEILHYRQLGATRVELGVQSTYEEVLKKNQRGHGIKEIVQATKILKDAGFKVSYHMMPGLWGSNPEMDIKMFETIFSDQKFQPDLLKIYPCVVTKKSPLFYFWKNNQFKPYSNKNIENILIKIKKKLPYYVRVSRLIRDIPPASIVAGPNIPNLRQLLKQKVNCSCIRCREVKDSSLAQEINFRRYDYQASDGKEIFLEFCSPDGKKLFSMLRLRIPSQIFSKKRHFISELNGVAIIREIHTYGKVLPIGKKENKSIQHTGMGKKLIQQAEKIAAQEFNLKKIAVISGVGVRDYYRKYGYRKRGTFLIKKLSQ